MKAHPTALVDPGATVADDVEIGPFCVVGPGVRIGPACRLGPRVSVQGPAVIGRDNVFHAHVTIGSHGGGRIEIGDANIFRESSHVDGPAAGSVTRIGSRNRLGVWSGIGSGGTVGSEVRLGGFSVLGENGVVEDGARIQGQCVIEPGVRIGRLSLTRSQVPVTADVPPFMVLDGNPGEIRAAHAPEAARG